jgi:hypothetical protein
MQLQRHGAHGAYVGRHIFAGRTIASDRRLDQSTIFIPQADRKTIEFELGGIFYFVDTLQCFSYTTIERRDFIFAKCIIQRKHRYRVTNLFELR